MTSIGREFTSPANGMSNIATYGNAETSGRFADILVPWGMAKWLSCRMRPKPPSSSSLPTTEQKAGRPPIPSSVAFALPSRYLRVTFVVYAPGEKNLPRDELNIVFDLSGLLPVLVEIMSVPLLSKDEYELRGQCLWPYLTKKTKQHRKWLSCFKGRRQPATRRRWTWWDVRKVPTNLDNSTKIEDLRFPDRCTTNE